MKFSNIILVLFGVFSISTLYAQQSIERIDVDVRRNKIRYYHEDRRMSFVEVKHHVRKTPQAYLLISTGRSQRIFSFLISIGAGYMIGNTVSNILINQSPKWELVAIGAGLVGVSVLLWERGAMNIKNGIYQYNQTQKDTGLFQLEQHKLQLSSTSNGVGFVFTF